MRLYRIGPARWLPVLSGRGASFESGGRWNEPGDPVLYLGTSVSLAMLEMSHYLPSPRLVPASYRIGIFEVPDDAIDRWSLADLPDDWNIYPHPAATRAMGSEWLRAHHNLVLLVPSCAVPGGLEEIAVINPLHPRMNEAGLIEATRKALYNPRAFREI
ncbi:RES family NAD+ phosphorylase [Kushneria aurantia]|uniref:RES family NAD+ phosphorylase n=1 Tax=Kushneria aurantia TaxID=504092 RepID=A0ABV6G616_9GAMM